ncbi:MAG: diguanylate cyclase [Marinobacter sp.]|uniref:diguanylate cyclase domain-containing protein n=1 Tax=Marinobacter sp. TaxID=50741 RepID=UPI00299F2649|nr:diguanylate cyclase [Marinobacter sp.]MDX1634934.1 diguanylate cyclase [Marinobacter sp.]
MHINSETSRILIVDDSPETIQMLSGLLQGKGQMLFATSGEDAIAMARKHQPHLILLDMEMPGLGGVETCRRLKSAPETSDCAVIFITASVGAEVEVEAFDAGAVDFISKPFHATVVDARVTTHLKLKAQSDALKQLVQRDGLTGVFSRRYLEEQLEIEFRRHQRQGLSMGLALLDLDHFKAFNDGYGHLAGDNCLSRVAEAMQGCLRRPGEFVARYGGEEFAVVLPHLAPDEADKAGEWLCQCVRSLNIPHRFSPVADCVTVSLGLRVGVPSGEDAIEVWAKQADDALYAAKAAGRDGYRIHGSD